jgi:hypothetical protein
VGSVITVDREFIDSIIRFVSSSPVTRHPSRAAVQLCTSLISLFSDLGRIGQSAAILSEWLGWSYRYDIDTRDSQVKVRSKLRGISSIDTAASREIIDAGY